MDLHDNEILTLWVGAFRYYLGRRTYAVGEFCDLLVSRWGVLPERTRQIIRRDLDSEFEADTRLRSQDRTGSSDWLPLGDDCDRAEWEKVRALWQV